MPSWSSSRATDARRTPALASAKPGDSRRIDELTPAIVRDSIALMDTRMDLRERVMHGLLITAVLVGLWQGYGAWLLAVLRR